MAEPYPTRWKDQALLLAAHGSSKHPLSGRAAHDHAAAIAAMNLFAEVHVAFWKEAPYLSDAMARIKARTIHIAPILAARGQVSDHIVPEQLGLPPMPKSGTWEWNGRIIYMAEPVGMHPGIADAVTAQARTVIDDHGLEPARVSVLLVGHGNPDDGGSAARTDGVARAMADGVPKAEVRTAFLENPPFMKDWKALISRHTVIVIPYMISGGLHAARDIPTLLGLQPGDPRLVALTHEAADAGPFDVGTHKIFYCRPAGNAPLVARLILEQVRAAG